MKNIGEQKSANYIALSEKWVSACKLKVGDKVLAYDEETENRLTKRLSDCSETKLMNGIISL